MQLGAIMMVQIQVIIVLHKEVLWPST